jgi:uncharacterized delta-60 repeat protein
MTADTATRMKILRSLWLIPALGLLSLRPLYAAPGDLDFTFGIGGKVTTQLGLEESFGVAVQSDGKTVVVGMSSSEFGGNDFGMVRYNADGTVDSAFGNGGMVTAQFIGSDAEVARGVAIQSDGRIVVAGTANQSSQDFVDGKFALVRYNADGMLDGGFGGTGTVTTDFGQFGDRCHSVALQADGKIVLAGVSVRAVTSGGVSTNSDVAVARYNIDGTLDSGFGSGGKVVTAIGSGDDVATSLAVQSDGKIVVCGYSYNGTDNDFALLRYNSNGTLDTGFGNAGKVTTNWFGGGDAFGRSVVVKSS